VLIQKSANLVEIKARGKFNRRHMVDIPRIQFGAQRRYRANWTFMDGHYLGCIGTPGNDNASGGVRGHTICGGTGNYT
jgi:hypothetical protein